MNVIGTQLHDPINLGLTPWRMAVLDVYMDAAAEIGRNPVSKHQIQPEYGDDEQSDAGRIDNLIRLILTLAICDDHTTVHTNFNSGYGRREAHINWSIVIPEKGQHPLLELP